jgi:hypothetical protein
MRVKTFRLGMVIGFVTLFITGCVQLERAGTATMGEVYASAKSTLPGIKEGVENFSLSRARN